MEINIDLGGIPAFSSSHCARLDNEQMKNLNVRKYPVLSAFIDKMGKLSADAQKLQRVLTSYNRIVEDPNQILYVLWEPGHKPNQSFVVGFLKIGRRNLYLHDDKMQSYQDNPICLLDFYVHHALQRKGKGKILYDIMLKEENAAPYMIAIDKPSDNLLFFLEKHYGLTDPCWQSTNYVVYPKFFEAKKIALSRGDAYAAMTFTPLSMNGTPSTATAPGQQQQQQMTITPMVVNSADQQQQKSQQQPVTTALTVTTGQQQPKTTSTDTSGQQQEVTTTSMVTSDQQQPQVTISTSSPASAALNSSSPVTMTTITAAASPVANTNNNNGSSPVTPVAAAASSNSLAKERKLLSMGHYKLW